MLGLRLKRIGREFVIKDGIEHLDETFVPGSNIAKADKLIKNSGLRATRGKRACTFSAISAKKKGKHMVTVDCIQKL